MTLTRRLRAAVLVSALTGGTAAAQAPVVPAGGQVPGPYPGQPCPCPPVPFYPGVPVFPSQPGAAPVVPAKPDATKPDATKPDATKPDATKPDATKPDATKPDQGQSNQNQQNNQQPQQPNQSQQQPQNNQQPQNDQGALAQAQAQQGGGAADATAKPGVFGDLFGGGTVRRRLDPRFIPVERRRDIVVVDTVRRQPLTLAGGATDELLFGQSTNTRQVSRIETLTETDLILAPEQVVRDASVYSPQFNRGTFKITENETPRPSTRAYVTYNFYDNLLKAYNPPGAPRIVLHQQNFGYEQAFADQQYSIGFRLPYNQIVGYGTGRDFTDTSLGDLTVIAKAVLWEDRATGDLVSGGLAVTAPTGSSRLTRSQVRVADPATIAAIQAARPGEAPPLEPEVIHSTLIQPFLGYILVNGDWFVQGFTSVVVPTDETETLFYAQTLALGYTLYRRPGEFLSGIYPVFETHANIPFTNRDFRNPNNPAGFADTVTLLGGTFFEFNNRSTVGFATGAPVTGPRPFSLQATVQFSIRF
jgi:hypothetical protein